MRRNIPKWLSRPRWIPPANFITIHYVYFIVSCLVGSGVFFALSTSSEFHVAYVDSLFLVVSAMTESGLNTVNLSQVNTSQQVFLWFLMLFGSAIWVSIWTVLFRKRVFERRFKVIVKAERERALSRRRDRRTLQLLRVISLPRTQTPASKPPWSPTKYAADDPMTGVVESPGWPRHQHTNPIDDDAGPATECTSSCGHGGKPIEDQSSFHDTSDSPQGELRTTVGDNRRPASAHSFPDSPANELSRPRSFPDRPTEEHVEPCNRHQMPTTDLLRPASHESWPRTGLTKAPADTHIAFAEETLRPVAGVAVAHPSGPRHRRKNQTLSAAEEGRPLEDDEEEEGAMHWRHILPHHKVGPNAQFYDLNSSERERLGGCEYRALKILAVVVPLYGILWQVLGAIAIGAWIARNSPEVALSNGVNPWWAGIFYTVSAFNNNGMSLIDLNMIPFQEAYFVLITMALLILAGNTAYPLFLRLIFWVWLKFLTLFTPTNAYGDTKSTLGFILNYPRRVYTNLFPSRPTWWLFFMVVLLNGIDWVLFEVLNLGNPYVDKIPVGPRILDGLFQAIAVRSGGFYVIPISAAYPGLQVVYMIMMYISVYPVVITIRHSNVYEERSLGIYADDPRRAGDAEDADTRSMLGTAGSALKKTLSFQGVGVATPADRSQGRISFISQQIRGQLAHDLWWLALAVLLITIIETRHFLEDPVTFNVFNVLFEVVSAYGTVGISVGLPNQNYSFAGAWNPGSKLVLCLVMIRGRHRGLPVALDRAIRLPSEDLLNDEEEDHRIRARSWMVASRTTI